MNNHFDNVFFYISKLVIVIPIIIIILAIVMKFNYQQKTLSNIFTTLTPTPTIIQQNTSIPEVKIDLKGPIACNFVYKDASISAHIKDKKISLKINNPKENINILVSGDCYYRWMQGYYTGEKTCGISQLLTIAEISSQFNLLNFVDLIKYFPILNNKEITTNDEAMLKKAINTCKKNDFNESIFELPNTVIFKNKVMPTPTVNIK